MLTFQQIIQRLQSFWGEQGCALLQPYDMEVGAGTSHTATFLRALGPEPWRAAYVQPSRRPKDGRYGENPNRLQHYYQYQVVLKPSPPDILDLYLRSLQALDLDLKRNDVRFVEDDWENPTLGAWGLGWEVWLNGMEITQFTYFQQVGGLECNPITGEITYGLERLAMYLQEKESLFDLVWTQATERGATRQLTYRDVYHQSEVEQSTYNFEQSNVQELFKLFTFFESDARRLLEVKLPLPGYEMILKAAHTFNLLDARGAISVTERAAYIGRIRTLSRLVAHAYVDSREALGYPMLPDELTAHRVLESAQRIEDARGMSGASSLVVEVVTEELPPKALELLGGAFSHGIAAGLKERGYLTPASAITPFATPRRLAVAVTEVLSVAPDVEVIDKLMPLKVARDASGRPSEALKKKLAGLGRSNLATASLDARDGPDHVYVASDGKADYVYLRRLAKGQPLVRGLQDTLDEVVGKLPVPKMMSYAGAGAYYNDVKFVRPARRLLALHGAEVVPVAVLRLPADRVTTGHRFRSRDEIRVATAEAYEETLRAEGKVVASFSARRALIVAGLRGAGAGATVIMPEALLDEVTALVESPAVYEGAFDPAFLAVPQECLILTMQQNQKYFALAAEDGKLFPRFLVVSNLETADSSPIIQGNERVLRARLADARFFFDQDKMQTLESRIPGLAKVVYHNKLGSQFERLERIVGIAVGLADAIGEGTQNVERAARLSKADLQTQMVGEFPELQGIMGEYYARHDGEVAEVATAIREHYLPRFAGDVLPSSVVGDCVSLADKVDALVSLFGIGERPTGDRDPYALRRHALGVIRLLTEKQLPVTLDSCIDLGVHWFESDVPHASWAKVAADQARERGQTTFGILTVGRKFPADSKK